MSVRIVYHGHSNLEIFSGNHRIQIDPFYDSNPLADVKSDKVSPQFILLTHAHFDHVDDVARIARRTHATVACNFEMANYYEKMGVATQPMNHGGGIDLPFGRVTMTIAFHTSSFPDGTYGGQPGGLVIETGGKVI